VLPERPRHPAHGLATCSPACRPGEDEASSLRVRLLPLGIRQRHRERVSVHSPGFGSAMPTPSEDRLAECIELSALWQAPVMYFMREFVHPSQLVGTVERRVDAIVVVQQFPLAAAHGRRWVHSHQLRGAAYIGPPWLQAPLAHATSQTAQAVLAAMEDSGLPRAQAASPPLPMPPAEGHLRGDPTVATDRAPPRPVRMRHPSPPRQSSGEPAARHSFSCEPSQPAAEHGE